MSGADVTAPRRSTVRHLTAVAAIGMICLSLASCKPEPEPGPGVSPTSSTSSAPPTTPSAAPSTASPTTSADPEAIALPGECSEIYSAGMLAALESQVPPLNDPRITLLSTSLVPALEILDSGAPSLHCTWGVPSQTGIATDVTIVDSAQSATVLGALQSSGFDCEEVEAGTLCASEQTSIDRDDNIYSRGESHLLRANGWVATTWITLIPDGYTQDIATALWG